MKLIPLTRGLFTQVDDEDYETLSKHKWNATSKGVPSKTYYAVRTIRAGYKKRAKESMHRVIMGVTDKEVHVDHIDRNTLNNQKSNLRTCTNAENSRNKNIRKSEKSTSKYIGVSVRVQKKTYMTKRGIVTNINKKYIARITHPAKKDQIVGLFPLTSEGEILAAKAYNEASILYHGEFAKLNTFE